MKVELSCALCGHPTLRITTESDLERSFLHAIKLGERVAFLASTGGGNSSSTLVTEMLAIELRPRNEATVLADSQQPPQP